MPNLGQRDHMNFCTTLHYT